MKTRSLIFVFSLLLLTALQGCGSSSKTFSQRRYLNLEKPDPVKPLPTELSQATLTNETQEITKTDSILQYSPGYEDSLKKINTNRDIFTIHQYEQADSVIVLSVAKRNYYLVNTVIDSATTTPEGNLIRTPFEVCPADSLICVGIKKYEAIDTNRIRINNADIGYVSKSPENPGETPKPFYGRFWLFFGISLGGTVIYTLAELEDLLLIAILGITILLVFGIWALFEIIRQLKNYTKKLKKSTKKPKKSKAHKLALVFLGLLAIYVVVAGINTALEDFGIWPY